MTLRVAYQGEPGAYSDLAAREALGGAIETVPCESFDAVFERLAADEVERAVVPVENSLAGTIHRVYDLTKIESRPLPGDESWAYMFHLDFVTDDFTARGARALEHLGEVAPVVELLGVYARDDRPHEAGEELATDYQP